MMRRLLQAALAVLVPALLATAWLSRHSFSRTPREVEAGLQGEALENRTLLLQKWLEAAGRPVVRRGGYLDPGALPRGGTLILLQVSQPVTPAEAQGLLGWVREGGFLLTDGSAAPFDDERGLAALHGALDVRLGDRRPPPPDQPEARSLPMTDTFKAGERPYRVSRTNRWRLFTDDPDAWTYKLGWKDQYVLLTREEGRGRISLTPDLGFVYRQDLAGQDHAAYLERLLAMGHATGPVVVWSKPVESSLFSWLWLHARAPGLSMLVLLAAWIWKGWGRLGPRLPDPVAERRSLREHLVASARFLWAQGAGEHLVRRAREALEQRAATLNPAYPFLDPAARADWLALASGGSPEAIFAAMDDRPGRSAQHLAQDLLTLDRVRQRIRNPASPPSQDAP